MAYKIVYRLNARLNVLEAKSWYKQQRPGLEKNFATALKEAVIRIQTQPEVYAIRYKNVRIVHTNIFPFNIHFYIDKNQKLIVVTNILHDRRDF